MDVVKVALISDSHDNVDNLIKAVDIANNRGCTHLFHLGDIVSPYTAKKLGEFRGEVIGVFGNCDGDKIGLNRTFSEFSGIIEKAPVKIDIKSRKIILMHEPKLIDELSESDNIDYIFYGHLHEESFYQNGNTRIINPGETAGILREPTFNIITLENGERERVIL